MAPIVLSSNGSSVKPVHLYQNAMIKIVTQENTVVHALIVTRLALTLFVFFVFKYEEEI